MTLTLGSGSPLLPMLDAQLDPEDVELVSRLQTSLTYHRARNQMRLDFYEMRNLFRDLNIAIPPQLRNLEVAMGWPAKAVDLLARRVKLEGFVLPDSKVDDWGIPGIWDANRMDVEAPQAIVSSLINPPAYLSVSLGDVASGEPEVLIGMSSALQTYGMWNPAKRGLRAVLQVLYGDENGPGKLLLLTGQKAVGITRLDDSGNRWDVRTTFHNLGRVPVEPLVYRPTLDRPFGSSRINRAVRSITTSAMRTVARSEVGAEFFITPQRYLLGADEDMFVDAEGNRKSTWDLVMGRILSVPAAVDESGEPLELPKVGQFAAAPMTPHAEHLRMWATMMAGETGLSLSSLGVVQDNPSSAEAIYAAKEDLILEAEGVGDGCAPAFVRTMTTGIQMRENLAAPPPELARLGVRWRDPSTPSRAASTDAVMKQIAAGVLPADSEVALEALGYDDTTIARVVADRRRAAGRELLNSLASRGSGPVAPAEVPEPEAAPPEPVTAGDDD